MAEGNGNYQLQRQCRCVITPSPMPQQVVADRQGYHQYARPLATPPDREPDKETVEWDEWMCRQLAAYLLNGTPE